MIGGEVGFVGEAVAEEDVHDGEGEQGIGAGADGEVLIGEGGGAGAVGVDDDELCALAAGLLDEGPEVDVVAMDVGSPGDNQAGVRVVLGRGAEADAVDAGEGGPSGGGADGAVELGGSEAVEEAAVHGAVAELADGSGVAVREDGFGAVFFGDGGEFSGDFGERLVPGDALEGFELPALRQAGPGDAGAAAHGIEEAVGSVDAVEELGDLAAEEAACNGVGGVALDAGGSAGELCRR